MTLQELRGEVRQWSSTVDGLQRDHAAAVEAVNAAVHATRYDRDEIFETKVRRDRLASRLAEARERLDALQSRLPTAAELERARAEVQPLESKHAEAVARARQAWAQIVKVVSGADGLDAAARLYWDSSAEANQVAARIRDALDYLDDRAQYRREWQSPTPPANEAGYVSTFGLLLVRLALGVVDSRGLQLNQVDADALGRARVALERESVSR